ncbi:MAG: hypothetical protein H6606_09240 [Flavobacteriales bacterium]|nr:hypothetical protein [Flavobacteriales bacterium]
MHRRYPFRASKADPMPIPDSNVQNRICFWNHGLSSVIQNLIDKGLRLTKFNEYDAAPANIFPKSTELHSGWYAPQKYAGIFPVLYALEAQKPVF